MSKVYESLKEVVHERLQHSKNNPIPLAWVKHTDASSLTEEINELEKNYCAKDGWIEGDGKAAWRGGYEGNSAGRTRH